MENKLTVTINETELPIKEYQGQRVVTLKEIDTVHDRPEGTARKRFNDNKKRFLEGVDFFVRNPDEAAKEFEIIAPNGLTLLTESGYLMLVKSFTDDLAWTVQRQLVNTYFRATGDQREDAAKQTKQQKQGTVKGKTADELNAADKRATAMLLNAKNRTASFLQNIYNLAGVKPEYQAMALSSFYSVDGVNLPRIALQGTKVTYDKGTIAGMLGIYSKASGGNEPHAQAIGAIISQLDVRPDEREPVPYTRNGHDGTDYQYTDSVVEKARAWLDEHNWPAAIPGNGKSFAVVYKEVSK